MELNVLRGMTSLLRKYRPKLAVEIHSGVNRNELLDLVKSAGYVPEGRPIEPLLANWKLSIMMIKVTSLCQFNYFNCIN
jgi:hypothetical protein